MRCVPPCLRATIIIICHALLSSDSTHASPLSLRRSSILRRSLATQSVVLTSRTGYSLAIAANGTVYGTTSTANPEARFVRFSEIMGVVVIRGAESGRYLAINADGQIVSRTSPTEDTQFLQALREDGFVTYKSLPYHHLNWFLGLKGNGKPVKGPRGGNGPGMRRGWLFTIHRGRS